MPNCSDHRPSRQTHLDSLRGLAATLIVVVHYFCVFFPYAIFGKQGQYVQHRNWESWFYYPPLAAILGGYSMVCIFFVLSGYVLSYNFIGKTGCRTELLSAIAKRPIRLGGMVLFTVCLGAWLWSAGLIFNKSLAAITHSVPYFSTYNWNEPFQFSSFLRDVLTDLFDKAKIYNNPMWTIGMELEGSLLVFAFLFFWGANRLRLIPLAALFVYFRNHEYQNFLFGMLVADLVKNYSWPGLTKYRSAAISVCAGGALFFVSYPNFTAKETLAGTWYRVLPDFRFLGGSTYGGYPTLGAFFLFVLVCISPRIQTFLRNRWLCYIGYLSYGIYATHFLVLGSLSAWLFPKQLRYMGYTSAFLVNFLLSFAVILAISHLIIHYVDVPMIRLSSKIGKMVKIGVERMTGQECKRS